MKKSKKTSCKCRPLPASCGANSRLWFNNNNNNLVTCRLCGTTWITGKKPLFSVTVFRKIAYTRYILLVPICAAVAAPVADKDCWDVVYVSDVTASSLSLQRMHYPLSWVQTKMGKKVEKNEKNEKETGGKKDKAFVISRTSLENTKSGFRS